VESLTLSSYLKKGYVREKLVEINREVSSILEASRIAYYRQESPIVFRNVTT